METITFEYAKRIIGERRRDSNKGSHGKALLLAGSEGFTGAALMAAAASLRAGVGTLKLYCPEAVLPALYVLPEAMVVPFKGDWDEYSAERLSELIGASTCIAVGPGMGRSKGGEAALRAVIASGLPAVIDADGLNMLSCMQDVKLHDKIVLTPHPGEMSRLTGLGIKEITGAMQETDQTYASRWGCTVLLKGASSVIAAPDGRCMLNESGNPGLAKGGSGDVLCGIILALLGQGLCAFDAACAGAYLLGVSADNAMQLLRERMLLTRDVVEAIENTISEMKVI